MAGDSLLIGLNALANASRARVDQSVVVAILAGGDGPGHLVRALFEDCSLETLFDMGLAAGLSPRQVRSAYGFAKRNHGARNPDFEADEAAR